MMFNDVIYELASQKNMGPIHLLLFLSKWLRLSSISIIKRPTKQDLSGWLTATAAVGHRVPTKLPGQFVSFVKINKNPKFFGPRWGFLFAALVSIRLVKHNV